MNPGAKPTPARTPVDPLFRLATQLHQKGRLPEAEQLYRSILAIEPRHFGTLLRMGSIRAQGGQHDDALTLFRRAAQAAQGSAAAHAAVGSALATVGRPADAVACYRRALILKPDYAEAYFNLGVVLQQLGRHVDAVAGYEKALALRPDLAAAHNNLGNALQKLGRFDAAIEHYHRALAIQADYADAYTNLGNALVALGRSEEAVANYEKAIAIDATKAEAHNNLGGTLQVLGRFAAAAAACARALALKPDYAEAHANLGYARHALGRSDDAIAHFRQALVLRPDFAEAYHGLGASLEAQGRLDDAYRAHARAVELAPRIVRFHYALAHAKRFTADDPRLAAMEILARDVERLSEDGRIRLHFALGKAYADLDEHKRAFRHVVEGNARKRKQIAYDEAAALRRLERTAAVFTPELMAAKAGFGDPSPAPVFVVGMPRSGTTLVEQILASHSKAFGAGELEAFGDAVAAACGAATGEFPAVVGAISHQALRKLGTTYLDGVVAAAPMARRIVDKQPSHVAFVGLIHLVLPHARIIHVRRDPLDTCLSCFSTLFGSDRPYTYDLAELGRYYAAYEAMMAHWRTVLPKGVMIEVQYEDVVDDLEGQARRLLTHCGLEWEDACLAFHKTQRPVHAASAAQVRQPIYRDAVGRWRPYRPMLKPLVDAIEGARSRTGPTRSVAPK